MAYGAWAAGLVPTMWNLDRHSIAQSLSAATSSTPPGCTAKGWPESDFRHLYFSGSNLSQTLERVAPLKAFASKRGLALPDLALRYVLAHPAVTTAIPGMRRLRNVEASIASSDAPPLDEATMTFLRGHRWNRQPDARP